MAFSRHYVFNAALVMLAALLIQGCSSSGVTNSSEISADELPMVDANTDALPETLEDPGAGSITADTLAPEAPTDIPAEATQTASAETTSLETSDPGLSTPVEPLAQTEPPVALDQAVPTMAPVAEESIATETASVEPSANGEQSFSTLAAPTVSQAETSQIPSVSTPSAPGDQSYVIEHGDTLMKIAFKCYGDIYLWKKVLDDNRDRIHNPNQLVAGVALRVDQGPSSESIDNSFQQYLIQFGDTLGTISKSLYGTPKRWRALWKWNEKLIHDPNRIYAGFSLRYLPGSGSESSPIQNPAPALTESPVAPDLNGEPNPRLPSSQEGSDLQSDSSFVPGNDAPSGEGSVLTQ